MTRKAVDIMSCRHPTRHSALSNSTAIFGSYMYMASDNSSSAADMPKQTAPQGYVTVDGNESDNLDSS